MKTLFDDPEPEAQPLKYQRPRLGKALLTPETALNACREIISMADDCYDAMPSDADEETVAEVRRHEFEASIGYAIKRAGVITPDQEKQIRKLHGSIGVILENYKNRANQ